MTFMDAVAAELQQAEEKFGPMNSGHEAYGVIREELEEFFAHCRKWKGGRMPPAAQKELVQIAAMAWRASIDLGFGE